MPVSTGSSSGEPRAKRCKLCDESNHKSESGSGYWELQLDRDLIDTISAIYPEWFKNNMTDSTTTTTRDSPPKAVIDTSPLMIDRNKESLKVKLMLRRPHDQLVAQGIMPPHKTPAFHGQRRQLERARTGDMLKAKIQQRPPRQELERRHILESGPVHIDPSLVDRQRMLEKARLADQLNNQLSHRPGPLELIRKNILHTEEPIEQAVKTGQIPYKATSEGQLNRPQHPHRYMTPEEDSQSSEGDTVSPAPSDVLETAAKSAGIVVIPSAEGTVVVTSAVPILNKDSSEIVFADFSRSIPTPLITQASVSSPASLVSSTSSLSPLSAVASPVPSILSQPATPAPPPPPPPPLPVALTPRPLTSPVARSDAPGKDKNRKKSKSKSVPKARTIKFHEYKGPPSAQKSNLNNANPSTETSYDLLLQQQTLLLQFQLALQHKYPQIILPASQKAPKECIVNSSSNSINNNSVPSPASSSSEPLTSMTVKFTGRLEDMKVSDLKAELKRRNLPVSGSKPQLIERLKPYTINNEGIAQNMQIEPPMQVTANVDDIPTSPQYQETHSPEECIKEETPEHMDISDPVSPLPTSHQQQDIVKEQQRRIEELQRELTLSQLKLQAATRIEPKAELLQHLQAKQQTQQIALQMQQLQALQAGQTPVDEEQQRLQQEQHIAFQNQKNISGGLILNGVDTALVLQLVHDKTKLTNGHNRTSLLSNFLGSSIAPIIARSELKPDYTTDLKNECIGAIKPPPLYEEATKQSTKKNNVKSQIVDDVLEILIKNGELPPSAAQDPSTPGSVGTKSAEPIFPSNQIVCNTDPNSPEAVLGLDANELLESLDNIDHMDFSQLVMELGGHQMENNNISRDQENLCVPMDTDEWLESLLPNDNVQNGGNNSYLVPMISQHSNSDNYDPVLAITQEPFDPFNLDDFRPAPDLNTTLSWDKVDFTT